MTIQLGSYIEFGRIDNTTRNSVVGGLKLRGKKRLVALRLSGNCSDLLAGKTIEFCPLTNPVEVNGQLPMLGDPQIGPTGTMSADGGGIRLEWFGQNGRTLVELPSVQLKRPSHVSHADTATIDSNNDPVFHAVLPRPGVVGGPAGMLRAMSDEQLVHTREKPNGEFNEALFGRMDDWQEITSGLGEIPISSLVRPSIVEGGLHRHSDVDVTSALRDVLAQLARIGISLEICAHFQPRQSYRYVTEVILSETIHPKVIEMGFVCYYLTLDQCDQCDLP